MERESVCLSENEPGTHTHTHTNTLPPHAPQAHCPTRERARAPVTHTHTRTAIARMEPGGSRTGCRGRARPAAQRAQRPEAPGTPGRAHRLRRDPRRGCPQRRPAELQEPGASLGPAARRTPFRADPPGRRNLRARGPRGGGARTAAGQPGPHEGAARGRGGRQAGLALREPTGRTRWPSGAGSPCARRAGWPGLRAAAGAGAAASRAERAVQPSARRLPEKNPTAPALGWGWGLGG